MKTQRGKSPEVNKEDIRRGLLTWEARPRGQGSGQPLQLRSQGWPSQESQERGWLGGAEEGAAGAEEKGGRGATWEASSRLPKETGKGKELRCRVGSGRHRARGCWTLWTGRH